MDSRRSSKSFERGSYRESNPLYDYMLSVAKAHGFSSISHAISIANKHNMSCFPKAINIYTLDNNNNPLDFVCRFNTIHELSQWENIKKEYLMFDITRMFLVNIQESIYVVPIYKVVFEN